MRKLRSFSWLTRRRLSGRYTKIKSPGTRCKICTESMTAYIYRRRNQRHLAGPHILLSCNTASWGAIYTRRSTLKESSNRRWFMLVATATCQMWRSTSKCWSTSSSQILTLQPNYSMASPMMRSISIRSRASKTVKCTLNSGRRIMKMLRWLTPRWAGAPSFQSASGKCSWIWVDTSLTTSLLPIVWMLRGQMRSFSVPLRSSYRIRAFKSCSRTLHRFSFTGISSKSSKFYSMGRRAHIRLTQRSGRYSKAFMRESAYQHWENSWPE